MTQLSPFVVPDLGGHFLKIDVIRDAYSKLRISGLTVDPTPSDLELALGRLENMMAEWYSTNIVVGYNFESVPDPNTENGVIRSYQECMSSNLAVRLIPDFNKEISQILFAQASASFSNMCGRIALDRLNGVTYPTRQPVGSGNSLRFNRWWRFYRQANVGINNAAQITMFIGDINDYEESFEAYLLDAETIATYSIVTESALVLVSDSSNDNTVFYRIEATNPSGVNQTLSQAVTIIVTTSTGRVETRQILFALTPKIDPNA